MHTDHNSYTEKVTVYAKSQVDRLFGHCSSITKQIAKGSWQHPIRENITSFLCCDVTRYHDATISPAAAKQ